MPLTATVPVHIMLAMTDSAPPRFLKSYHATEVVENQPLGQFIILYISVK